MLALNKFSKYPIIVITDEKRNKKIINHDYIISIDTPSDLDNHRASIWLKTSIHKILPENNLYCYLDSDVIALNNDCNKIFKYYKPPITFARDHTNVYHFSPYAVNCGCLEAFVKEKNNFEIAIKENFNFENFPPDYSCNEYRELNRTLKKFTSNPLIFFKVFFNNIRSIRVNEIKIKENIKLGLKNKEWVVNKNFKYPVLLFYRKEILQKTGFKYSFLKNKWYNGNTEVYRNYCNHLSDLLKMQFNVNVPYKWQHWNGGVFLFDKNSKDFLDTWHKISLEIMNDKKWKVRDQSSLIATVFLKNLQNHYVLPEEYNFIADFYNTSITSTETYGVYKKGNKLIKPNFIHIYHEWGNMKWDVWNKVASEVLNPTSSS